MLDCYWGTKKEKDQSNIIKNFTILGGTCIFENLAYLNFLPTFQGLFRYEKIILKWIFMKWDAGCGLDCSDSG